MSEAKRYRLRQPVVVEEYQEYIVLRATKGSSFMQEIPNAVFDKLFCEVVDDDLHQQIRAEYETIVTQTIHGAQYVMARQKGEAGGQDGIPDDRPFREIWDEYYRYIVIDGRIHNMVALLKETGEA